MFKLVFVLLKFFTLAVLIQLSMVHSLRTAKQMDKEVQFVGSNEYECMIMSKRYRNNYLYAVSSLHKLSIFWRDVNVWAPVFFSGPKEFTEKDKQGVWIFKPVTNRPDTYFLQNKKYGEFLFAIDKWKIDEKITPRRMIFTYKSDSPELDEKFMWYFKKLDDNSYEITNVKFNERKF